MSELVVVVACDSFKGSLTAREACRAVAAGVRQAVPSAEVRIRPIADGGEGTLDVVRGRAGTRWASTEVVDAFGRPKEAPFAIIDAPDLRAGALVEAATVIGLPAVQRVDGSVPPRASSRGVGMLIRAALLQQPNTVRVGLGGTSTTDGGTGALLELGVTAVDDDGEPLRDDNPLWRFAALTSRLPDLSRIEVLSDVSNPLTGALGAAMVFGPQKGATPDQVAHLEAQMQRWADALAESTGRDVRQLPGAGAAGGLAGALLACGASIRSGFDWVAQVVGLDEALLDADLVITGEGSIDAQTARGKGPAGVAALARRAGTRVVAVGGRVSVDLTGAGPEGKGAARAGLLFDEVRRIHPATGMPADVMDPEVAAAALTRTASEVIRDHLRHRDS